MLLLMRPFFNRLCRLAGFAGMVLLASCAGKEPKAFVKSAPQAVAPAAQPSPAPATASQTPAPAAPSSPLMPAASPPVQGQPDPVPTMIAEAEKAYASGHDNYKAGRLDAAKQDFNRAVDILMQGPVDVKSDDRLQQEFDKITEEITALEMDAFKAGDGFSEQQPEPAPIDEANEPTCPVDPNVKA